jgi:hypothetical protein
MKVTVKIGKAVVARKSLKLAARGKRTLRLALGKKALKRVRKGARIAFTVDVADTAGNLGTAKDSVKLR